jgi:hypothetical protein
MQEHIEKIKIKDNVIVYIHEPDSHKRKSMHEDMKNFPSYRLRSRYEPSGHDVRCDNCFHWTSTEDAVNACCGRDHNGCNSTHVRVNCSHCEDGEDELGHVYFYYDEMDDFKLRPGLWKPTGDMILMLTSTKYKHLNTKKSSYRKRYIRAKCN